MTTCKTRDAAIQVYGYVHVYVKHPGRFTRPFYVDLSTFTSADPARVAEYKMTIREDKQNRRLFDLLCICYGILKVCMVYYLLKLAN